MFEKLSPQSHVSFQILLNSYSLFIGEPNNQTIVEQIIGCYCIYEWEGGRI